MAMADVKEILVVENTELIIADSLHREFAVWLDILKFKRICFAPQDGSE